MKLAETSHRKIESFFREYLDDKSFSLPQSYFYTGRFSRIFTAILGVHGITFGRQIFILPSLVSRAENQKIKLPESLVVHEVTHVLQYRQEGVLRFVYKYLKSYWSNLKPEQRWNITARRQAYLAIPYEIEARRTAAEFVKWSESFTQRQKTRFEN
jgi:hypothetical protein